MSWLRYSLILGSFCYKREGRVGEIHLEILLEELHIALVKEFIELSGLCISFLFFIIVRA